MSEPKPARAAALSHGDRSTAPIVAQPRLARCLCDGPCTCGEGTEHRNDALSVALRSAVVARQIEGETIGDEADVEFEGMEAERPVDGAHAKPAAMPAVRALRPILQREWYKPWTWFQSKPTPAPAPAPAARSFHPTMTVVTPGTRTTDCGAYTYKVKWGIPASETASSGWVVQKVTKQFEAKNCDGTPVAPQGFDDTSNYPFWEAWEFTPGQNVWVGAAAGGSVHGGDTFSGPDYGPGTKGKKTVTGEVKAIVGFVPPAHMTRRDAAPAWALPYTRTEPPQFASAPAGATHQLVAEWDCCPNGTVTKATTLTTNP